VFSGTRIYHIRSREVVQREIIFEVFESGREKLNAARVMLSGIMRPAAAKKTRARRGGGEGGGISENEKRNLGKETREEQQEGKVEGPSVT